MSPKWVFGVVVLRLLNMQQILCLSGGGAHLTVWYSIFATAFSPLHDVLCADQN